MISIIVPVYNTKPYLDRCIQSIVSQEYEDIEILLIDDYSNDGSSEVLDEWARKDKRIHVIHKNTNSGVSDSRNIGLLSAKGEFIGFVDSDDWLEPEMYLNLHYWIKETGADIAFGGFRRITKKDCAEVVPDKKNGTVVSVEEALVHCIPQRNAGRYDLYLVNKLFRRESILNDGSLPLFRTDLRYGEDVVWFLGVLLQCRKIVYWQGIGYNYDAWRDGNTWTTLQKYGDISYAESALTANQEIYRVLKEAHSASANNALQRVLFYQEYAIITALKMHDDALFDHYAEDYLRKLIYWVLHNKSSIGVLWTLKRVLKYCKMRVDRVLYH